MFLTSCFVRLRRMTERVEEAGCHISGKYVIYPDSDTLLNFGGNL